MFHIISLTLIICSEVSFCEQAPFTELCNLIIGPDFESRDSSIKVSMSQTPEALKYLLATSHTVFDAQTKTSLMDCLELCDDVINHLNHSTSHMSVTDAKRWLSATVVNHHTCLNGFKYFNFSKLFEDMQVESKLVARKLSTINDDGLVQLAEGVTIQPNLLVAQDYSGDFSTITEAIEEAENQRIGTESTSRFIIYVKAGIYNENIIITQSKTNLMLIGDGIDATVITNDKNVHDDDVLTTNTATVQVWGQGFVAVRITFENTAGPAKEQAVALLSAVDLSTFYQCSFKGYQDTLCVSENRQFLRECDIYGTVDFIFGYVSAVLQNCHIYVRTPMPGRQNTITAQGRNGSSSNTGFVIENSRIIRAPDTNPTDGLVKTYLGPPWRDYSRVVYLNCDLGNVIDLEGWLPFMDNTTFDKLCYAEYMNIGEIADTSGRIKWSGYHVLMTDDEAEQFSVSTFLLGESWIPGTGVPFS